MTDLNMPEFTLEEIQMLAELEQKMDTGEVPYVMWRNQRLAVMEDTFALLKFKQGQTISDTLFHLMLRTNISILQAKIAVDDMKNSAKPSGDSHD